MLSFLVYNTVLLILSPFIILFILYRILISGKSRASWRDQIGFPRVSKQISSSKPIWIHAVSVGESVASAAVVDELKESLPQIPIVVSTTTITGNEMAKKSIKSADEFIYYPFDLAPFVISSISRVKPLVFASTDTEIWPNFRYIANKSNIKTAMINGTISDGTMRGSAKIGWIYRWAFSQIHLFCMQSQADADRAIKLGADPSRVLVTGNCKADQKDAIFSAEEITELHESYAISADTPVFVAGSTNPGEDEPVIDAFLLARKDFPKLKLIIAPRQIERKDEIIEIAEKKNLKCAWRSEPQTISGAEDIVILNTFGELAKVYALADVSFVGGSLIPKGCHSILQPISCGKPVFFGPYTFKAKDLVAQAKDYGVGFEIKNGEELGEKITKLLSDSSLLSDIDTRCRKMMDANKGASKRTADALVELYEMAANSK